MKSLLSILTFLLFSTCVPVTYHKARILTNQPDMMVQTQVYYQPYYSGIYSFRPTINPPYLGNVYHKPHRNTTVIVRGGRRK